MTRVRIAAGSVEVEATGAKAEHLAEIAADLWHQTQCEPPRRSNWLLYGSEWTGDENGLLTTTNGGPS
jgi:hypothetical protein